MPALVKRTFHGFIGPSKEKPEPTTLLPSITLPPCGDRASMLGAKLGWPLNHMSAPASSLAPATVPAGMANDGASCPSGTKITSPKPVVHLKRMWSPLAMVIVRG